MKGIFIETPLFTRLLPKYLSDAAYLGLQQTLLRCPDIGELIRGTGGFRKLRWRDSRRGKGTRGGLRVIYYWLRNDGQIWLFTIYDKDETADLAPDEKQALKAMIKAELAQRKKQ